MLLAQWLAKNSCVWITCNRHNLRFGTVMPSDHISFIPHASVMILKKYSSKTIHPFTMIDPFITPDVHQASPGPVVSESEV